MKVIWLVVILSISAATAQSPQPPVLPITQTIWISHFGAKGDGKSDDSQAFAAGIAAASRTGAALVLEDKTYVLKDTLRIPHSLKPLAIVGSGHTTLIFAPSQPLESGIVIEYASGVQLKNFIIRGSAGGLHAGIRIVDSSNIRVEELTVENIHGSGISLVSAIYLARDDQAWIADSTFQNIGSGPGRDAVVIWNYYEARSKHIYITHNHFLNNTAPVVIGLFDTDNSVVQDNVIEAGNNCVPPCRNNGYGILFYRTPPPAKKGAGVSPWPYPSGETIAGNQITNTAGSAIYLASVHDVTISKNLIAQTALRMDPTGLPTAGIALNGVTNATISDNTIDGSGQGGIALATTQDILIERNQIHNSAKWGMHLRGNQLRTTIHNNTIDGAPLGIYSQGKQIGTAIKSNILKSVKHPN